MKLFNMSFDVKVNICPCCDGGFKYVRPVIIQTKDKAYRAVCMKCGIKTIEANTYRKAVKNWNRRLFKENDFTKGETK